MAALAQSAKSRANDYGELVNMVAATNDRQDQITAQAAANKLTEIGTLLQIDPKTGFNQVRGGAAANQEFATNYTKKFEDAKEALAQSLANDNQRSMFVKHADITSLHYKSALLQHQATQTNAFNDKTADDTMDLGRRSIFQNPGNKAAFAAGMAQIEWGIQQKAKQQGWDKTITDDTRVKYLERVYEDSVALDVERDPRAALAMLNQRIGTDGAEPMQTGNPGVDALDTSKLIELRRRAAAYVARDEASKRTDQDRIDAEALKALNELQAFALSGAMPDQKYAARVRTLVGGTQYAEAAEVLLSKSLIGASFGAQSLPRQQEWLRQLEVDNAKGSSPEMMALHKQAQAINQTQTKAYTDNPWDAWTQFGRGPETKTENLSTPGTAARVVAKRLEAQTALETVTGFTVSPLKPDEATAWANSLASLPPEAKASELGVVGDQLSAPRLKVLADQIDAKNRPMALSLKLGADQTTAGRNVSALVLRGAQALSDKTVKRDDAVLSGWRAEISGMVRGTLGDPRAEDDVIDSAYYVRAAMDQDGIAPVGFKLPASMEHAIKLVIGLPIERNGVKMLLPRGMDENQFDKALSLYTPEVIKTIAPSGTVYLRGQPVTIQRFSDSLTRYGMKRDGNGNFLPSVGGAFITLDPAGQQPIRLPVKQ
jgi:hypothetical protein